MDDSDQWPAIGRAPYGLGNRLIPQFRSRSRQTNSDGVHFRQALRHDLGHLRAARVRSRDGDDVGHLMLQRKSRPKGGWLAIPEGVVVLGICSVGIVGMDASVERNVEVGQLDRFSSYRPDIDVLRAIAVMAVLCFHWNVAPFRGGFVGVDVFFVISGFLITRIIFNDIEAGNLSFVRFYERRIRRILPALYAVIIAVVAFAWFLMFPAETLDLTRSIVAVIFFSSNILFWHEAGYFDATLIARPLLHTWSLAVEEQFYLIFPALMLLFFRLRAMWAHVLPILVVIGVASFAYSVWQVKVAPSSAFYLAQGRAWEFIMGSVLAVGNLPLLPNRPIRLTVATLGIVMVMVTVVGFRSSTPFPGMAALLPCGGTALCIWANTGRVIGTLESAMTRPFVFYGTISYSLCLPRSPARN
jgi:peptidoglycan/LPS O-acetylase OafA/YrhL